MKKISVVVPTYNESMNVKEFIRRVDATVKNLKEVIIVDDDSPDKTWEIAQKLKNPRCKVIRRKNEKGLASALARGVKEAKGEIIVWLDCDLGIPPEEIPKLIKEIGKYDVVIGSRYVRGGKDLRPRFRAFLSVLTNFYANLLLGFDIKDYTSGFIAMKRGVTEKIPLNKKGFGEYFIEFVYRCKKNKFKIKEVGYEYKDRETGISKSGGSIKILLKYGIQYILKITKLGIFGVPKNKKIY